MDTSRHNTIISPTEWLKLGDLHIIGCGATASNLLYILSKLDITNTIHIYDFDNVEEHNLPNQFFTAENVGENKAIALKENILKINSNMNIVEHTEKVETLEDKSGVVFCLVDTMQSRKVLSGSLTQSAVRVFIDTRLGDFDFHYYIIKAKNEYHRLKYAETLCTDTQASVSLCGTKITLLPTIMVGVSSLILELNKMIKKEDFSNVVQTYASTLQTIKRSWK